MITAVVMTKQFIVELFVLTMVVIYNYRHHKSIKNEERKGVTDEFGGNQKHQ